MVNYNVILLNLFPIIIFVMLIFVIVEYKTSTFRINGTRDWGTGFFCLLVYSIIDMHFSFSTYLVLSVISSLFYISAFIYFQYAISKYNDLKPQFKLSIIFGSTFVLLYGISYFLKISESIFNILFSLIMIFILFETMYYIMNNSTIRRKAKTYIPLFITYSILILYFIARICTNYEFGVAHNFENSPTHTYILITNIIAIISISLSFNFIYKHHYIDELKELNNIKEYQLDIIKQLSETDNLTKIPNRHKLEKLIKWYIDNRILSDKKTHFCFVLMDLDRFKLINDTFGHQKGDEILIAFSKILSKSLREDDHYGRWGGDEFVVIIPNSTRTVAKKVINKLQLIVGEEDLDLGFQLSFSYGISECNGTKTFDELYKDVDERLYIDKEKKKDHFLK